MLRADVVAGVFRVALRLVQTGARDEVLHVAVVGARVQDGVTGLRRGETLEYQKVTLQEQLLEVIWFLIGTTSTNFHHHSCCQL